MVGDMTRCPANKIPTSCYDPSLHVLKVSKASAERLRNALPAIQQIAPTVSFRQLVGLGAELIARVFEVALNNGDPFPPMKGSLTPGRRIRTKRRADIQP